MSKDKKAQKKAPRRNEPASDRVSPPVSDSTLKAVKQLMPNAKKLPRKGWGE